ncbi:tRNA1(Val) (adenine(37)-N6)-methyltransferase [Reyranella soli]|jgi:tRNA1(Val) A37 N6-methylase TrmN6|uniref:Methyltransferase n=1 Tax=Reyranella soli TaxID=1230389 RepID=A0A512NM55_9HYPH|nr:methyltransferase [Reyranella soli]GEP60031.1 methyltransferase [Reyranella soli]
MEGTLTEDALLGGRVQLLQPARGYRVAVDAVLLAAAVDAAPGQRILDLGAGVGAVGLCLAVRIPGCSVVGIELQGALAELAERNANLNGMADRVRTVIHDLATPLPADLGRFDHVVTNPPYLAAAVADPSPHPSKALATVESSADLARWLTVATTAAEPAGTLLIIHRSDRLDEIFGHLDRLGWGDVTVKRLPPAARVLVRARRADRPTRRDTPPLTLHRPDGRYTDEAEAILRHAGPLAF